MFEFCFVLEIPLFRIQIRYNVYTCPTVNNRINRVRKKGTTSNSKTTTSIRKTGRRSTDSKISQEFPLVTVHDFRFDVLGLQYSLNSLSHTWSVSGPPNIVTPKRQSNELDCQKWTFISLQRTIIWFKILVVATTLLLITCMPYMEYLKWSTFANKDNLWLNTLSFI